MNYYNLILGVLLLVLGTLFVFEYIGLIKQKKHYGLTVNIAGSGLIAIIIGIGLILREVC